MSLQYAPRRLALVDAFAILFRTHHAYGSVLKDRNGKPTSIVYGFVKDIITLMELTPRMTHWAIVFDFSGKNFRQAAPLLNPCPQQCLGANCALDQARTGSRNVSLRSNVCFLILPDLLLCWAFFKMR